MRVRALLRTVTAAAAMALVALTLPATSATAAASESNSLTPTQNKQVVTAMPAAKGFTKGKVTTVKKTKAGSPLCGVPHPAYSGVGRVDATKNRSQLTSAFVLTTAKGAADTFRSKLKKAKCGKGFTRVKVSGLLEGTVAFKYAVGRHEGYVAVTAVGNVILKSSTAGSTSPALISKVHGNLVNSYAKVSYPEAAQRAMAKANAKTVANKITALAAETDNFTTTAAYVRSLGSVNVLRAEIGIADDSVKLYATAQGGELTSIGTISDLYVGVSAQHNCRVVLGEIASVDTATCK